MPGKNYTTDAEKVRELLTEVSQRATDRSGFVKRRSKLDGEKFVQTMVLGCLEKADQSLSELAQVSGKLGVKITGPGLDQRIDAEGVLLLQEVLQESLKRVEDGKGLEIAMLRPFSAVYLTDSTQMELPAALAACFPGSGGDASPAAIKVQVMYDYLSGTFRAIEVGAANQPDQSCRIQVNHSRPGALHLFDLGYFKQQMLAELDHSHAFFLTRLDTRTALFSDDELCERLDLLSLLRKTQLDRLELHLQVGIEVHLPARVLFQRLPAQVVAERRRKAIARMKAKGRTPSQDYLDLLEWNCFITNVPDDWLSFDQLLLLYHVRWQIELVFKLFKSLAGFDHIGPWRKERLLVHLYARLIGLVLFYALAAPFRWLLGRELSWPKAFRSFQAKIPAILRAIHLGWHAFPAVLKRLFTHWCHFDLKTHRIKHPSTLESLFLSP
jgi:hypothetical protein